MSGSAGAALHGRRWGGGVMCRDRVIMDTVLNFTSVMAGERSVLELMWPYSVIPVYQAFF